VSKNVSFELADRNYAELRPKLAGDIRTDVPGS
jgi:hypothetical protein